MAHRIALSGCHHGLREWHAHRHDKWGVGMAGRTWRKLTPAAANTSVCGPMHVQKVAEVNEELIKVVVV